VDRNGAIADISAILLVALLWALQSGCMVIHYDLDGVPHTITNFTIEKRKP
jgi:nitrogen fixation-related uncharacterized protein